MSSKAATAADARQIRQIPNIGPAMVADLQLLGIHQPAQLAGRDPYQLYHQLCTISGVRHDPCVIDVFIAAVRFMEGAPATPWWHYTTERKARLAAAPAIQPG